MLPQQPSAEAYHGRLSEAARQAHFRYDDGPGKTVRSVQPWLMRHAYHLKREN